MLGGTLVGVWSGARLMDALVRLGEWRFGVHHFSAFRFLLLGIEHNVPHAE